MASIYLPSVLYLLCPNSSFVSLFAMRSTCGILAGLAFQAGSSYTQEIINGQIFTPGIAIVDAPQPNTPLGEGNLIRSYRFGP